MGEIMTDEKFRELVEEIATDRMEERYAEVLEDVRRRFGDDYEDAEEEARLELDDERPDIVRDAEDEVREMLAG